MIAFAFVGTALLAYIFEITRAPIEASEKEARLALFKQILPESAHDNDLLQDTVQIAPSELLGNALPSEANVAKLNNKIAGVILEAIAHDGYSGDINCLLQFVPMALLVVYAFSHIKRHQAWVIILTSYIAIGLNYSMMNL